ncbi:MAG: hypothetical protein KIT84_30940 [Labilithrix sp.]|nr:hypothetical protein [Labilithrix sp.]MCW5815485.1 hypothetical protein [Labilithrix sp.]
MRARWARLVVVGSAGVAALACTTDYQQGLEDPNYGGPSALKGQKPPGPTVEATDEGSSGGGANQPLCVKLGGALLATPPACNVKFSTDVMQALAAGSCSTAACHGGAEPANQPKIDPADLPGSYASMAAFPPRSGKPYINPCSIDPALSVIDDNLDPAAPAADRGTVMPPGSGLVAAIPKVREWLQCGSPNN